MQFKRSRSLRRPQNAPDRKLRVEPLERRNLLAINVFPVNDFTPAGTGTGQTLSWAITQANDTPNDPAGPDKIVFELSDATQTIAPQLPLPAITEAVVIDGFDNDYATPNTNPLGQAANAQVLVEIDGASAGSGADGLYLGPGSAGSTIRGLAIRDFGGHGIVVASDNNSIVGNYIGVAADGTTAGANALGGVLVSGASGNTIGGAANGDRNLIAYNGVGVAIVGAGDDTISLNLRDLSAATVTSTTYNNNATDNRVAGNHLLNNTAQGALIQNASRNTIEGNLIGDNGAAGVEIAGQGGAQIVVTDEGTGGDAWEDITLTNTATGNVVRGNYIGLGPSGQNLGNSGDGVLVNGASFNTIGGVAVADRNIISYNAGSGARVTGAVTDIQYTPPAAAAALPGGPTGYFTGDFQTDRARIAALVRGLTGQPQGAQSFSAAAPEVHMLDFLGDIPVYNRIQGNYIGANVAGDAAAGNGQHGVLIEAAARVTVVGAVASGSAGGNLIGGNALAGVKLVGEALNAHPINEPADSYRATPNDETPQDTFSLNDPGLPQTFENRSVLPELMPTSVIGNRIGVNDAGALLGNGADGVFADHGRGLILDNTISANAGHGVQLFGTPRLMMFGSIVAGNRIGTRADGTVSLDPQGRAEQGNHLNGVLLDEGAQFNYIGALDGADQSRAESLRNVISGNWEWGVRVSGLRVAGQDVFHVERNHDPFLFPEELNWAYGTIANSIEANYIGVDHTGAAAAGNKLGGVLIEGGAAFTTVGSWNTPLATQWYGNVISGNDGPGVQVTGRGTSVAVIAGNFIGLKASGDEALRNLGPGVIVENEATATNVGGDAIAASLGSRNYIAGNQGPGILIQNTYDLRRAIINPTGSQTIGAPNPAFFDPITGLPDDDAWSNAFNDGTNYYSTAVVSNWIGLGRGAQAGTDSQGEPIYAAIPIPNLGDGVRIIDSSNIEIGGLHSTWSRNVIAANQENGIHISGDRSFLTFVSQAFVGVRPDGSGAAGFGNTASGLLLDTAAHHNMISGTGVGFELFSTALQEGDDKGDLGEGVDLARIEAAWDDNEHGNVISGNAGSGVAIDGAHYNRIAGANYIGTDFGLPSTPPLPVRTGQTAVPNADGGVRILGGSTNNLITAATRVDQVLFENSDFKAPWGTQITRVVISGNSGPGVLIEGAGTTGNLVQGAILGTQGDGTTPLPNAGDGVLIASGASNNRIETGVVLTRPKPVTVQDYEQSDWSPQAVSNTISHNSGAGVEISSAAQNTVTGSTISHNSAGGVVLFGPSSDNLIGGETSGAANVIGNNGVAGVVLRGTSVAITAAEASGGYLKLTLASAAGLTINQVVELSRVSIANSDNTVSPVPSTKITAITGNTVTTNSQVAAGATPSAANGATLAYSAPWANTVASNYIGTDALQGLLGNLGEGVLLEAGAHDNWLSGNAIANNTQNGVKLATVAHHNTIGVKMTGETPSGAGNNVSQNGQDGLLINGTRDNTIRGNTLADNAARGVTIDGGEGNMLLANTIEDNDAGGILIEGDGAEGNAIGVQVVDGANDLPTIANAPIEPNVVSGNGGYAIQVDGDQARYNLISGGNTISADGGDAAIYLSNGARANIIGDGGEGFSEQDQGYIEGHGNRIEYGAGQVGVKSDANPGVNPGDGGEGNTIIGNNFVGDLSSAISLTNPNTAHFVPPVLTNLQVATNGQNEVTEINVDYELPADAALRDVQGARFRIDFYLLDGQGQRIYLGGPLAYDPYTGQTTFTWPNNSGLTSFSGWQLAATTTYYLANDELRIGSLTSELTLLPIS